MWRALPAAAVKAAAQEVRVALAPADSAGVAEAAPANIR
jgi:hypothetical protein